MSNDWGQCFLSLPKSGHSTPSTGYPGYTIYTNKRISENTYFLLKVFSFLSISGHKAEISRGFMLEEEMYIS